jgi:hypothetical protein
LNTSGDLSKSHFFNLQDGTIVVLEQSFDDRNSLELKPEGIVDQKYQIISPLGKGGQQSKMGRSPAPLAPACCGCLFGRYFSLWLLHFYTVAHAKQCVEGKKAIQRRHCHWCRNPGRFGQYPIHFSNYGRAHAQVGRKGSRREGSRRPQISAWYCLRFVL